MTVNFPHPLPQHNEVVYASPGTQMAFCLTLSEKRRYLAWVDPFVRTLWCILENYEQHITKVISWSQVSLKLLSVGEDNALCMLV